MSSQSTSTSAGRLERCDDVQGRDETRAEIGAVRRNLDILLAAELDHPQHFADAADLGDARLRDVDRAGIDQRLEAECAGDIFAGGNADAVLTHAREPEAILRRIDRLLEPGQPVAAHRIGHLDRVRHRPGAIDVEHDTRAIDARRILGREHGLARHLVQLDMPVATRAGGGGVFRDQREIGIAQEARIGVEFLLLAIAAEQTIERLAGFLAADVPERDLDPGIGVDERTVAPEQMHCMQNGLRQRVDVLGVAPDHQRRDNVVERRLGRRDRGMAEGFTPPGDAFVGLDLDQKNIEMRPRLSRKGRPGPAHVIGQGHDARTQPP